MKESKTVSLNLKLKSLAKSKPVEFISFVSQKEWVYPYTIIKLDLERPKKINFLAGQYITVIVNSKIRRPYSIASSPLSPRRIELCIDTSPRGWGSRFFENIRVGDKVNFIGPLGSFTLPDLAAVGCKAVFYFLATGCGITPLKSHILYLLENKFKGKIKLYFGCKSENVILYKRFFEDLEKKYGNFEYIVSLSRPSPSWEGRKGWVTKWFDMDVKDVKNKHVFICGNPNMRDDTIKLAKSKGFRDFQIHYEKFV